MELMEIGILSALEILTILMVSILLSCNRRIAFKKYFIQYFFITLTRAFCCWGIIYYIWSKGNQTTHFINYFILIFCNNIFSFFIAFRYSLKIFKKIEIIKLKEGHISCISEVMQEIRGRHHDFNNHLHAIYGITETTEGPLLKNKIQKYIEGLSSSFKNLEPTMRLDNSIVSGIIFSKIKRAEENKIFFEYYSTGDIEKVNIEDYELIEIIGNLIDNAFEAILSSNEKFKHVIFKIGLENSRVMVEVRNNGARIESNILSKIFDKGFSTKEGSNRGYGLYNVKRIVTENKGEIIVSFEDNYMIFKILF